MAIVNDPRLYSGGSVVFNSQPATQFYLQSEAKKRAKDEALDNYYRDFNKSLNPAGMRNQDIEGWMNKVNDWRGFYQQNKDAIKNPRLDNGKAQSEYMARYQDALSDTQRSKNAGEISKGYVMPVITNPDKRSRLTDISLGTIASHDASIYDPNHKELDPTKLDFDAKPFGLDEQKKLSSYLTQGVKMDEIVEKITKDPKTQSKTISYEYKLNPEALKTVGARAANTYKSDDRFQAHIDQLAENPDIFNQLNEVFKGVYGKDIVSNEDFAAAYGLNQVQKERDVQKVAGYNPFAGQSSWGSNQKVNPADFWSRSVVQAGNIAAQTGDVTQLRGVVSQLFTGNGSRRLGNKDSDVKYEIVGGRPSVKITTYPTTEAEKDKEYELKLGLIKEGKMSKDALRFDGMTSTFYLDEPMPQLLSKLGNMWQLTQGGDAAAEKIINYEPPSMPTVTAPKKEAPKKTTTKKKIAGF